jgi:hypothetical protein
MSKFQDEDQQEEEEEAEYHIKPQVRRDDGCNDQLRQCTRTYLMH